MQFVLRWTETGENVVAEWNCQSVVGDTFIERLLQDVDRSAYQWNDVKQKSKK